MELPDGSYSVSDIQDYFDYFIKKHETVTDNLSIMTSTLAILQWGDQHTWLVGSLLIQG